MGNDDATALGLPFVFVGSDEELAGLEARCEAYGASPFWEILLGYTWPSTALVRLLRGKRDSNALRANISRILGLGAPLAVFSQKSAVELFKFDVDGVPSAGRIYVRHPHIVDRYLAPEEFSRAVAREKEAAVRQLASALGAKKLVLVSGVVHGKGGLFSLSVPIKQVAAEIGIRAEFDAKGEVLRSVYSEFGPPTAPPYVPDDLRPWVDADPDLRTMARTRIEGNLMKDQVRMEFSDSLHAGASVAAKVASVNVGAATEYRRVHRSTWQFEVEYWPKG